MLLKDETIAIQRQLAGYCRDGQLIDIKGAKTNRLHHYRRLVYNITNNALIQAYPITHQILREEEWEGLINDFFTGHDSQSNQIWKMPFELFEFVRSTNYHTKLNRPYLLELIHFEWLEIEVYCMPDQPFSAFRRAGDPWNEALVINPDFRLLALSYPIHKVPSSELQGQKGSYFVLIFRDPSSGKVNFIDLSQLYAVMWERLSEASTSGRDAMVFAGNQLGIEDETLLKQKGTAFIEALIEQRAILGMIN